MTLPTSSRNVPTPVHQQNLDLFTFVLRCVSSGDSIQLSRAGFTERDVLHLRSLSLSQLMDLSDQGLKLSTYLNEARRRVELEGLSQALIEQRAPRELMLQLFRMSTRRYATERMRMGIAGGRGRPSTTATDSATEHRIWRLWVLFADAVDPRRLREPDQWLLISQELPGQLRTSWALIQRWSRQKESLAAFNGDRARLGEQCRKSEEQELRDHYRESMKQALSKHAKAS